MRFICLCTNGFMAFFLNSQLGPGKGWGGEEESLIPVPALPICRGPARGWGWGAAACPTARSSACPLLCLCLSPPPPPDSSSSCTAAPLPVHVPAACPRCLSPLPVPLSPHRTIPERATGRGKVGRSQPCRTQGDIVLKSIDLVICGQGRNTWDTNFCKVTADTAHPA